MKNFIFFAVILIVLIIIGAVFLNSVKNESQNQSQAIVLPTEYEYFWSETCPHCANVAEFMESWDKKDKIQMQKIEVNESLDNKKKFVERGDFCQIPRNQLGVPLLITPEGICLSGDEPIIEYLKNLEI